MEEEKLTEYYYSDKEDSENEMEMDFKEDDLQRNTNKMDMPEKQTIYNFKENYYSKDEDEDSTEDE